MGDGRWGMGDGEKSREEGIGTLPSPNPHLPSPTEGFEPRGYQRRAVDDCLDRLKDGAESVLLVLATGTGKTKIAGDVIQNALEFFGRRSLFLVDRRRLALQAVRLFSAMRIDVVLEMGQERPERLWGQTPPSVTVATRQSLIKRLDQPEHAPDRYRILWIDEAHDACCASYRKILAHYPDAWKVGLTATPERGDGRNLGRVFREIAFTYTIQDALDDPEGPFLVPPREEVCRTPIDLAGIRQKGKDLDDEELAERIAPQIEAMARGAREKVGERRTVAFLPSVKSAQAFAAAMDDLGVKSRAVWGQDPHEDLKLEEYARGDYQLVACCDLLGKGWDDCPTSAVIIGRPTRVKSRFIQAVGRATRLHRATRKKDALIVNFDWRNRHDLITSCDLFDDSALDTEEKTTYRRLVHDGTETDPQKAMERAQEVVRQARELRITLQGRNRDLQWKSRSLVQVAGTIGLHFDQDRDFHPGNPITPGQRTALEQRHKIHPPPDLSAAGARRTLKALDRRQQAGLCSPQIVQALLLKGLDLTLARSVPLKDALKYLNRAGT